nr:alpha/beta fold hydrolase [Anaerotalea alkaliphila]
MLLVHGTSRGTSSIEFDSIVRHLSKSHTVYRLDLIGYGNSDKPKITYTAYLYIQLLGDFIKDVIGKGIPVDVIGAGKSAAYLAMACHQDPTMFKKMIFINPEDLRLLGLNPSKKDRYLKWLIESPLVGTSLFNLFHSKKQLNRLFKSEYIHKNIYVMRRYSVLFYENTHVAYNTFERQGGSKGSLGKFLFASEYCNYTNVSLQGILPQINNSIYVIQGASRSMDYRQIAEQYRSLNAAIEFAAVDHAKEFPHLEKPESTLEIIQLFLHE